MDLDLNKVIPTRAGDFGFKRSRARISNSETSREMRKLRISRVFLDTSFLFHISFSSPPPRRLCIQKFSDQGKIKNFPLGGIISV